MAYDKSKDKWAGTAQSPVDLGVDSFDIETSDTVDLPVYPKSIWVGTAGTLVVIPLKHADDTPVTYLNVPVGEFTHTRVRRVLATSTAGGLLGNV